MIFPDNKLNNPFYFINDGVLYEISNTTDKDGCGKHLVEYYTVSKPVSKGKKYLDHNGTIKVAEEDSTYDVSTGELDLSPCKERFPWICVAYIDNGETKYEYYWLEYLIKDGDTYDGTFHINQTHQYIDDKQYTSYVELYKDQLINYIQEMTTGGYSLSEIKKRLPYYVIAQDGDNVVINGKTVIIAEGGPTNCDGVDLSFTDEEILDEMYKVYNDMVIAYANRLLAKSGKKLSDDFCGVNSDTVVDINDGGDEPVIYTFNVIESGRGVVNITGYDFDGDYGHVPSGTQLTITGVPDDEDYVFSKLTINGKRVSITNDQYTFTVYRNTEVVATFTKITPSEKYDILETITEHCSLSFSEGVNIIPAGTEVTVTAFADNNSGATPYYCRGILVNGEEVLNPAIYDADCYNHDACNDQSMTFTFRITENTEVSGVIVDFEQWEEIMNDPELAG